MLLLNMLQEIPPGCSARCSPLVMGIAVQELKLSYQSKETTSCTVCVYIHKNIYPYHGNLIQASEQQPTYLVATEHLRAVRWMFIDYWDVLEKSF